MRRVKVRILKGFTRKFTPRFVFKKGQIIEMIVTESHFKSMKENEGEYYKITYSKKVYRK